jgi:hypothetical protein
MQFQICPLDDFGLMPSSKMTDKPDFGCPSQSGRFGPKQQHCGPKTTICMRKTWSFSVLPWTIHPHGQFIPMDNSSPWTIHPHGQFIPVDNSSPWTIHPHGQFIPVDNSFPWTIHPRCSGISLLTVSCYCMYITLLCVCYVRCLHAFPLLHPAFLQNM